MSSECIVYPWSIIRDLLIYPGLIYWSWLDPASSKFIFFLKSTIGITRLKANSNIIKDIVKKAANPKLGNSALVSMIAMDVVLMLNFNLNTVYR